jgi:hypothetical protein
MGGRLEMECCRIRVSRPQGFTSFTAARGGDVKARVYVDERIELSARRPGPDYRPRSGHPGGPDDDVEAFLKPDAVHSFFAQDLPESSRWLIVESQRPITGAAGTTPSGLAAWRSLPSWAMVGTKDRV